ncbi:hypothetical protein GK047_10130 [Paenibacillus sp. SYP-B3998]|uniref:Lipoprotein n=1 Tax=Paenibacillus sp. SYP-B3998 TaxID=2678564 RepID=A0A6G3ZWE6_9BACL|nr:hypothetical protein [Paenibacillus sp. SYP-B3998]NEW06368.1 hypothetical protein [Paenibacillus sp. SYP-B3998]
MKVLRIARTIPAVLLILSLMAGCEKRSVSEERKQVASDQNYEKQLQIAQKQLEVANKMVPAEPIVSLSTVTQILTEYYPMLFKQKDEDSLFEYYARMTWHTSEKSKEKLKKNIDKHVDYLKIKKMYADKILPLKHDDPYPECRVTEMNISYQKAKKGEEGSYKVHTVYELYKKDQTISFPVDLTIPENSEFFSSLFASADDNEPYDYGVPSDELSKTRRDFMNLLIGARTRTLTVEESKILLE